MLPCLVHEHLRRLAPESFAIFPVRGRDRTVGLLTLFTSGARAPITAAELQVAADIAGRAGLALDSARLYRQQRQLAEGLRRSLLTAPAQPDHAQVVVRYTSAAEVDDDVALIALRLHRQDRPRPVEAAPTAFSRASPTRPRSWTGTR